MLDKYTKLSLFYDFYGKLLTKRQQEVMSLYHEENFSLSEIAKEFGISRQGVHDAVKNAEDALAAYEDKLGLVQKFAQTDKAIREIDDRIDGLIAQSDTTMKAKLEEIKTIIDGLNF
ncbi:MAG: YlxM family DNA-binding protein [Anaerovoracaceae bacterium]